MGKMNKRLGIIAAVVAMGLMCAHSAIKSSASSLEVKDTKADQTFIVNEERVPGANVATA